MSRPLRIEFENAFYHVISRGHRLESIFTCDYDKDVFLKKLGEAANKYQFVVHAFSLMTNHYHLLIETPQGNLSKSMHQLNASYSNWFCQKYEKKGSLFQGRYKAILVEKDAYLKVVSAYIHLNPVRAGYVADPTQYNYSSCRFYVEDIEKPDYLQTADLLGMFNGKRSEYLGFIKRCSGKGLEILPEEVYGNKGLLGSELYLRQIFKRIKTTGIKINDREQTESRSLKLVDTDEIIEIMLVDLKISEQIVWENKRNNLYKKMLIYCLKNYTASSLQEIGELFEMDYSAVSIAAKRFEREINNKKNVRSLHDNIFQEIQKRRVRKE